MLDEGTNSDQAEKKGWKDSRMTTRGITFLEELGVEAAHGVNRCRDLYGTAESNVGIERTGGEVVPAGETNLL